jgi:hypothetical protein
MNKRDEVVDAPYTMQATAATITGESLVLLFASSADVSIPIAWLGPPWTTATKRRLENVTLQLGGSCVWWDDLDDGFVLDEVLPAALGMKPAAMLARRARGISTPKKAAAARSNGRKGGRPRKEKAPPASP